MFNKKIKKNKTLKKVSIGGQAVMEGVMMRGKTSMATAVRDSDGVIRVEAKRINQNKKNIFLRLPIVRGVVSFFNSLVGGTSVLLRSAEVFGEGEPTKFEKWLAKTLKINLVGVVSGLALIIGLFLSVFLFMWLPQTLRGALESLFSKDFSILADNLIEGGIKILIFIFYIFICSLLKDVKRTFMYHGAEHKTISCYERGLELTVENAKKCPRVHDRCGTTFMVFVMLISIVTFAVFESIIGTSLSGLLRTGAKILLLPFIAGISYELLKALAKTDCFLVFPLKIPGLLLQRLTTKEPEDEMLEVAITAFNKVMQMDNDENIPECKFVCPLKRKELLDSTYERLNENGITEKAEAEWILSVTLNVKRSQLLTNDMVSAKKVDEVNKIVDNRITGRPLWYCIGNTDFYGYNIKVDERCLIPRPETELLVEKALENISCNTRVLDLCCGSGAIAVAVFKKTNAYVLASDISEDALCLAKENAKNNEADIKFVKSDMFNELFDEKFDIIISNPPYIKSSDISGLQKEVRCFEPVLALDGGEDGLRFYRTIAEESKKHLNENGVVYCEIGYDQGKDVASIFKDFSQVEIIKDYDNNDRIVKAVL